MRCIDLEERAWAAGLFEGEGSFYINNIGKGRVSACADMGSTDLDILERFHRFVQVGHIRVHARGPRSTKDGWKWGTGKFEHMQYVSGLLWPQLGPRRQAQIHKTLTRFAQYQRTLKGSECLTVSSMSI